ncbi:1,4-alpha-glucan branching enzyme GlgB [Aquimixticola soesokkakensis]|uniref:1,4-alpha-glucan branching enzyme GlgB n=1 Tax=Aquimixticola soesokkakensis TaxID=1519096 RepID=A0A1Y5SNR4_9RHOB|nr:1,4-alpha-glucan branching protein GlgB [Aquimixticola soesokkakensis]SLN44933.1 1,4-alpha-glucan branching enzyme GlgB [Aquimixticola soesokkakensis]
MAGSPKDKTTKTSARQSAKTTKTPAPQGAAPRTTPTDTPLPPPRALRDLVDGQHGDPFSLLGLHEREGRLTLTVYLPGVSRVTALIGKTMRVDLHRVTGAPDVFTAVVRKGTKTYRLEAEHDGYVWTFEDPYRLGPVLGDLDEYLLGEGTHRRLWTALGAHVMTHAGLEGTHFAVWAPNAKRVSVVGDFNIWDGRRLPMRKRGATGVWEIFLPGLGEGTTYKYEVLGATGHVAQKADPVGFGAEHPPATASVVRDIRNPVWQDAAYLKHRGPRQSIDAPISIYEVHLGSWRHKVEEGGRPLSYLELATELVDYAHDMGFTHLELMPVSEFPFDGSWGYQPVGMYAPTIRFGTPAEFRALVDAAHGKGIGVLLDWVPGHFPTDAHGLAQFDGTPLYEHADPKEGFHVDWNTLIYNYGRAEVANYLISNALYWMEEYHIDGLRVDAVASMLYRDYSRNPGEWVPNKDGGRENYEAISLMQRANTITYGEVDGIMTIAEESTSYPGVSRPVDAGGLGFGYKWNMGWMNDSLRYMEQDPIHRKYHHNDITFSMVYAYSENFVLPISHDEVVHGKGSMIDKMPGEGWEKFANLRAYYGFMWTHPGKKLLFMGCEFAQGVEWNHNASLDWHLLDIPAHKGMQTLIRDLNTLYRATPALHVNDTRPEGFAWIDGGDAENSVLSFARFGTQSDAPCVVVVNFTPVTREGFRVGFVRAGHWREVLNSDASRYGGGDRGNGGGIDTEDVEWNGQAQSALLTLPPLSVIVFEYK